MIAVAKLRPSLLALAAGCLMAADFARAAEACPPSLPWCGGIGLSWIPLVVGLQFVFLYVALGGPAGVLGRYAGYIEQWSREHFAMFQIGVPLALVMSFPALLTLTLIDKWFHRVGLVEVVVIQGACWLWMFRRLRRREARPADGDAAVPASATPPELAALTASSPEAAEIPVANAAAAPALFVAAAPPGSVDATGRPVLVPAASVAGPLLPPGSTFVLAEREEPICVGGAKPQPLRAEVDWSPSQDERRALQDKLAHIYMWDDIGLRNPFKAARSLPHDRLLGADDEALLGGERLNAMRDTARRVIARYKCGTADSNFASMLNGDAVGEFDEYASDVMQRLTYSVLFGRQRLFVDRTDVEVFGETAIDAMYRLALYEVQADVETALPPPAAGGAAHRPALH